MEVCFASQSTRSIELLTDRVESDDAELVAFYGRSRGDMAKDKSLIGSEGESSATSIYRCLAQNGEAASMYLSGKSSR